MHALLHSSEEESPNPGAYNPENVRFSPSILHTPSADADISASQETRVSASQESHVSASQDSLATLPRDETSPTASVSSSSQAKEVVDVTSDNSKLEHDEYFEMNKIDQKPNRTLLRPATRRPRLYRHKSDKFPALLVFDLIDDGVRCATPGIIWGVNDTIKEVIVIASLGWNSYKKNSRSHKVSPAGPVYAFLRDVDYVGEPVCFTQILKLHLHTLFDKGNPAAEVDLDNIQKARELSADFVKTNKNNANAWNKIATLKIPKKTKSDPVAPGKRSSARIQRKQKKLEKENLENLKNSIPNICWS